MPSVTFLIAALFFSCLTARAETVSHMIPVNGLRTHCSFDLNGYVYNLCPIMGSSKVVEVPEESQDGRSGPGRYILALGGLGMDDGVVKIPGCNEGTWVCLTSSMHVRSQPVVQISKSSNLILDFRGERDHDPSQLQISLHGSKKDLDVVLLCSEVEQVELINVDHDAALRFIWASRHGCPRNSTRRREPESTLNTWTNGEQEPSGDGDEEEDELLPSDSRKARTGIAFVIVFIVLSVICGSALASSTRARHFALGLFQKASYTVVPVVVKVGLKLRPLGQSLNSLTSKAISGVRFRTSGDNLVRWAQEDMALESDIMVNGSARAYRLDEESWDGSDEYIPLATSPRFGTGLRVPSYGSTPEGPTIREGAVMGRMRKYFKI